MNASTASLERLVAHEGPFAPTVVAGLLRGLLDAEAGLAAAGTRRPPPSVEQLLAASFFVAPASGGPRLSLRERIDESLLGGPAAGAAPAPGPQGELANLRAIAAVAGLLLRGTTALPEADGDLPRWLARFTRRLGQAEGAASFRSAAQARDDLDRRDDLLRRLLEAAGANRSRLVPHPLEALYVVPSTVCNLRCRFCAYPKTSIPKQIMPTALFRSIVERACVHGFRTFGLTPLLGEALLDPELLDKLDVLEEDGRVSGYSFCTNLTSVEPGFVAELGRRRKLRSLAVSVYGHDLASFARIAGVEAARPFERLVENLGALAREPALAARSELRVRTEPDFRLDAAEGELPQALRVLAGLGARLRFPHDRYSNWGGTIAPSDLAGTGLRLKPEVPKDAVPCSFLFYKHTVLPDGRVNACYSDDAHATMIIGDLTRQSFDEIYSLDNDAYLRLVEGHCRGRFNPACARCSAYRPLEADHYSYAFHERPFIPLETFLRQLA